MDGLSRMLMYGNIIRYVKYVNNRIEGEMKERERERERERENYVYDLIVWCMVYGICTFTLCCIV